MSSSADTRFFGDHVAGRKGEILDAALVVFATEGYAGGSMRMIAEEVGLSEPALYRHFEGKEDLFLKLIEYTGQRAESEIAPILDAATPETIRETIREALQNRPLASGGYFKRVIGTVLIAAAHNPAFLDAHREYIVEPMVNRIATLVPQVDEFFDVKSTEEDRMERVRLMISLFVGSYMLSHAFDRELLTVDAVMRIMGWGDS